MSNPPIMLEANGIAGRGRTLNPFAILENTAGFIAFAEHVFDAVEVSEARTPTPGGTLIHAELRIGDSLLLLADVQDGWRARPGLFQVWTADVAGLVERAVARHSLVVTPPTPFYGSVTMARVEDPWGNLWWVYQPVPGQPNPKPVWEGGVDTVFRTIDTWMRSAD